MSSNLNSDENILVTGALGQLGLALIADLQNDKNFFVLATDIALPPKDFSVPFEQADVCDRDRLFALIATYKSPLCITLRLCFPQREKKIQTKHGN